MVLPVATPAEMRAIDADAPEPTKILIQRAAYAVANAAIGMLGGGYGRRVSIIAGKGNNGEDGRMAARLLTRRGVSCSLHQPGTALRDDSNLVIDAAYGTGFRDRWDSPPQPDSAVLAVDLPSGVDGLTGQDRGSLRAQRTVTFGALKPGLLLEPGASRAGRIEVADLGLDISGCRAALITDEDLQEPLSQRIATDHKWSNSVRIIGGSPGMTGATQLAAKGALRAGAGMTVVSSPTVEAAELNLPTEAVARPIPPDNWAAEVLIDLERFSALLVGPGLGTDGETLAVAAELIERAPIPVVIDADALSAVAAHPNCLKNRSAPTVLTPHDGEFKTLTGTQPDLDRCAAVRSAAQHAVVLLKGPTTLVANPDGDLIFVRSGDLRLATAGSGDVLAGIIAALIGYHPTHLAVAAAAHWHGRAAMLAEPGMIANDLPSLLQPARSAMLSS